MIACIVTDYELCEHCADMEGALSWIRVTLGIGIVLALTEACNREEMEDSGAPGEETASSTSMTVLTVTTMATPDSTTSSPVTTTEQADSVESVGGSGGEACMSNTDCTDDMSPVCDDGMCVQCKERQDYACQGATPICDEADNVCVGCTEHAQCGPSACNLFTGACVEGPVVDVGTQTEDYQSLTGALAVLEDGGTIIVKSRMAPYDETITVDDGRVVAFLAEGSPQPVWQRTAEEAPQLHVLDGSTVLMDGIALRNNISLGQPALQAEGSMVWLDRSTIAQNDGMGLKAESGADVRLRNCFVGGAVDLPALSIAGSSLSVHYSTVGGGTGDATAIECDGGSLVAVDDSIIISRGAGSEVECTMLTAANTAANTVLRGSGNEAVGMTMTTWFHGYNGGDFHLTAQGKRVFVDKAEWNGGDPRVDFDGDIRATVEGTAEHAGADLP